MRRPSDPDCLFCKISAGKIPVELVFESESVIAFRDINPKAPQHLLIIPRTHIATINDIDDSEQALIGNLLTVARDLAQQERIADDGYRLVMNCNEDAGQSVFHIHLHLLGGRTMAWPPG